MIFGWFKIVWFRTKTLRVLKDEFNYEPNLTGVQKDPFNLVTRTTITNGGNEYDAAIAFIISQIKLLIEGLIPEIKREPDQDTLKFVQQKIMTIQDVFPLSNGLTTEWLDELTNSPSYRKYYA